MRVGILTVSDRTSRGEREDCSGPAIEAWCEARGYAVAAYEVVADDAATIAARLRAWCDQGRVDLLLTTGGTGMSPRDVTPEATLETLERRVPGIPEQLRHAGRRSTPFAVLSRGVAGTRGSTLVVNLPGSPGGVRDGLREIEGVVEHAVALLRGEDDAHETKGGA